MALKNNISLLFLSTIFCCIATNTFAEETSSVLPKDDKQHHRSYLKPNEIANSVDLLPPPPVENSPAFMADQAAFKQAQSLVNTPRWALAQSDADLADHHIGKPFAQVLGVTISKENTPITYLFLKKIMVDSGYSGTHLAKKYYHRIRPFMYYHTQTCTPQDNHYLKNDGSYPSGHTAIGWSTALILSEMFPEKQNQILQRGYDFGESRVVCGVHWQSDVDAGRIIGSEIVARLHANKEFLQDFQKSKEELTQKMK